MTAFSQEYLRDPRYQKNLRKVVNMDPEQLAVYNALTVELPFADEEMRRRLQMYQLGAQKEAQGKRLSLAERGHELDRGRFDLSRDASSARHDLQKRSLRYDAKMFENRMNDLQDENNMSNILGMAGLGINAALGRSDLEAKKKLAAKYGLGAWT